MDLSETDEKLVHQLVADADRHQNDADRFSALFSEDAVLVNAIGIRIFGRENIRAAMLAALRTPLANVRTRYEIVEIRPITNDIVLVAGTKRVSGDGSDHAEPGSSITLSLILRRAADGGWRIALAHNTLARVPASP